MKYRVRVVRASSITGGIYYELEKHVWWCFWVKISELLTELTEQQIKACLAELRKFESEENLL